MKRVFIFIAIFLLTLTGYSQSFLKDYKKHLLKRVDSLESLDDKRRLKKYIQSHLSELDTVFKSYEVKSGFNFNTADTLLFFFETLAGASFPNTVIVWTAKDTIAYEIKFKKIRPYKHKRVLEYLTRPNKFYGKKNIIFSPETDTLMKLIYKRDFVTINKLGEGQVIFDGVYYRIIIANKTGKHYIFETYSPKQFTIH